MNTVKQYAVNDGVILEWGCGLCVKGQGSPKRLYIGEAQMTVRGQLYKDPWAEKEAEAKVLRQ